MRDGQYGRRPIALTRGKKRPDSPFKIPWFHHTSEAANTGLKSIKAISYSALHNPTPTQQQNKLPVVLERPLQKWPTLYNKFYTNTSVIITQSQYTVLCKTINYTRFCRVLYKLYNPSIINIQL